LLIHRIRGELSIEAPAHHPVLRIDFQLDAGGDGRLRPVQALVELRPGGRCRRSRGRHRQRVEKARLAHFLVFVVVFIGIFEVVIFTVLAIIIFICDDYVGSQTSCRAEAQ
jgi:hypothetical protein